MVVSLGTRGVAVGSSSMATRLSGKVPVSFPHDGRTFAQGHPDARVVALLDVAIIGRALDALATRPGSEHVEVMRRLHDAVSALVDRAMVAESTETPPAVREWYELLAEHAPVPRATAVDAAESLIAGVGDADPDRAWIAWGREVWAVDDDAMAVDRVADADNALDAEAVALARNTVPVLARAIGAVLDHLDATAAGGGVVEPTWLLGLVADAVEGCAQPAGFPPPWRAFVDRGIEYTWSFGRGPEGPQLGQISAETGTFGIARMVDGCVSVGFRPYRSSLRSLAQVAAFRELETAHAFVMLAATAEFATWDGWPALRLPRPDELLPMGVSIVTAPHPAGLGPACSVIVDGESVGWFPVSAFPQRGPNGYSGMRGAVACAHIARKGLCALADELTLVDGSPRFRIAGPSLDVRSTGVQGATDGH